MSDARDVWDASVVARHELAWPIRPYALRFAAHVDWPSLDALNAALADALGGAARFVPSPPRRRRRRAAPVAARELYDGRIALDGAVPTRTSSWHDFFNALVWAAWPRAKKALHARQHLAIAARVTAPTWELPRARTRELDRLAMLDEGGVVLLAVSSAAPRLQAALARGDRAAVIAATREGTAERLIFGHALYDHLRTDSSAARLFARPELVTTPADLPADHSQRLALADDLLARALADRRIPTPDPIAALSLASP